MGLGWGKDYLPGQPWGSSLAAGTEGAPPLQGGGLPGEVSLPLRIEMKVEISFGQSNGVLYLVKYV